MCLLLLSTAGLTRCACSGAGYTHPGAEFLDSLCSRADLLKPSLILTSVGLNDGLSTVRLRLDPVLAGTGRGSPCHHQ